MAARGPIEDVSCTVVALPRDSALQAHDFVALCVPSTSLTGSPETGVAIDVKVLISLLFVLPNFDGAVPPDLHKLMVDHASFPTLRVSTTRRPIFDNQMQNPIFGYRSLGFLSRFQQPSPMYIHAVDSGASDTVAWITQLALTNPRIRMEYHFIIVLTNYDNPELSPSPGPSPHSSPHHSSVPTPNHHLLVSPPAQASPQRYYSDAEFSPNLTWPAQDFNDPMSYNLLPNIPCTF
jgi:hypothetical protein